jgi:hypothetical protein
MKHPVVFRLLCILLAGCISAAHSHAVVRPSCCSPAKTEASERILLCDQNHSCCATLSEDAEAFALGEPSESDHLPGSVNDRGCCERNCCKVFQTLTFAAAATGYSFRLLECSALLMMNQSPPSFDFSSLLLRPPQA